jgi:hypothetical protein
MGYRLEQKKTGAPEENSDTVISFEHTYLVFFRGEQGTVLISR